MNHLPSPQADGHADVLSSMRALAACITETVLVARRAGVDFTDVISTIWTVWETYDATHAEPPQAPVDRITG